MGDGPIRHPPISALVCIGELEPPDVIGPHWTVGPVGTVTKGSGQTSRFSARSMVGSSAISLAISGSMAWRKKNALGCTFFGFGGLCGQKMRLGCNSYGSGAPRSRVLEGSPGRWGSDPVKRFAYAQVRGLMPHRLQPRCRAAAPLPSGGAGKITAESRFSRETDVPA